MGQLLSKTLPSAETIILLYHLPIPLPPISLPPLPPLFWLILSGVFFAGGEYLSKRFILAPGWGGLLILLCAYSFATLAWLPALVQQKDLSITGTIWSVISLCATVLIGVVIFGEQLTAPHIAGIVLATASIVLMSL